MLEVRQLVAGYGQGQVLNGVDLRVAPGEVVALLGRNGAGRSTLAKALVGLVPAQGSARWKGRELLGLAPFEVARSGVGYVPESRDAFPHLSVRDNLLLGRQRRAGRWDFDAVYHWFPRLKEREHTLAGRLSGGEQQMLALARTLMGSPALLILDEPTEGLAPSMVEQVADVLRSLRAEGVAILLIEQKLSIAFSVSDRVALMGHGRVVFDGLPQALAADQGLQDEWLAV
ncbi:ABC transporter ATP-binding protein [Hydrogenophaga sp.]|uniref:ABC transporter ATP-binding protein n=1 Tax=Hydrogenophaga sp. TaxID=1904254 RepID=UPI00391BE44E